MTDVDALVRRAAHHWDAHRFFEVHEELEIPWNAVKHERKAEPAKDPRRDLIHALILFAAAYVHWQRGNPLGVERKLADAQACLGATRLRQLAGVDWTQWVAAVQADLQLGGKGESLIPGRIPKWPTI